MPEATSEPLSQLDAAFERRVSRYVVGIDLGTTNCAVAFMDTQRSEPTLEIFRIEQMVDFQTSQFSDTLPSFHYELTAAESSQIHSRFQFSEGSHLSVVGVFARQRGVQMPGRSIASAKSWLCHTLVDRTSELLPWSADDGVQLLSPVQASRRYLEHIRRMWDRDHPAEPLEQQDVIVTLPASFDEVARRLTIQAATEAGLPNVILIEEPQAAFYAWLHRNQDTWTQTMRPGQSILVCDIGGGTTDFTLIRVVETKPTVSAVDSLDSNKAKQTASADTAVAVDLSQAVGETLQATFGLHRVAVGEHLMLGGDNLDLALARSLEQQLLADSPGQDRLRPRQWDALKAQCRAAKESLLGPEPPSTYKMALPGSGSKLIENTKTLSIDLAWAKELLVDGFFGRVTIHDRPDKAGEGFQEFGLPYAADPNVNKHLAAFLWEHRWAGRDEETREQLSELQAARPDWVLFNGGVLESTQIQKAILDQIADWFQADDKWQPGILEGNRLDLAVAQGAAYFGQVRRGQGVRIDARLARAYYLLVEQSPAKAMCVMPANAMPLDRFRIDEHPFHLMIGQPVQFPLFHSSTNLIHAIGQIVSVDAETMTAMPPIRTVLEMGNRKQQQLVPVVLESELSEIGTLAMNLVIAQQGEAEPATSSRDVDASWKLEFDVRMSTPQIAGNGSQQSALIETAQSSVVQSAMEAMESVFGDVPTISPRQGIAYLNEKIGVSRRDWSPSLLREMWRFLMGHQAYRKFSAEHESRWLNLVGWCLRPGFGLAADDWRVNTTWRGVHNKLLHRSAANASETIVLWRRIAGGFTPGQQRALFQDCWPRVRPMLAGGSQSQATNTNVTIELMRLVGSLEWLSSEEKSTVAEQIIQSFDRKKLEPVHGPLLWTLGRLGSRTPVYATLQQVVSASRVQAWVEKLLKLEPEWIAKNSGMFSLCLMQLTRRTDDRYRDVAMALRDRVAAKLTELGAPKLHIDLVLQGGGLDQESEDSIVGESLPLGFRLSL
ncbi:MAG: Hsp70 family protein [Planctomycetota bacterium]|nr:Hsp70 family protein [Planctomycetota bacterium]